MASATNTPNWGGGLSKQLYVVVGLFACALLNAALGPFLGRVDLGDEQRGFCLFFVFCFVFGQQPRGGGTHCCLLELVHNDSGLCRSGGGGGRGGCRAACVLDVEAVDVALWLGHGGKEECGFG